MDLRPAPDHPTFGHLVFTAGLVSEAAMTITLVVYRLLPLLPYNSATRQNNQVRILFGVNLWLILLGHL